MFLFVPLFFPPRRPYAGIFFLVFVLFRPCSCCLFLFRTYVILLAAIPIFLHHIIQNSCRLLLFCLLSFSALCRYPLPRLRVVPPVQQLSVPIQHVCCSSCSLSDLLASHSSKLMFFFVFLVVIALIFLVWLVLLCSRTRYARVLLASP